MTVFAVLIAVGIPAVFLCVIYTLDLYASRTFQLVLLCFAWGAIGGLGLSFAFNQYVALPLIVELELSILVLYVVFGPIAEELLKSLWLFYVSRRPEFTYFVDGAIYGFAAGIGFSITENIIYLTAYPDLAMGMALMRAFSTCLMHGTAAALVGAAVGRFRFRQRSGQRVALVGGWAAAIFLHAAFNGLANVPALTESPLGAVVNIAIGLGGVGLIVAFIVVGLREERAWLAQTLDLATVRVTDAEVQAAQAYGSIEEVLKPIIKKFPQEAEQVQDLVLLQAQLGIKRKVHQRLADVTLQQQLDQEIAQMQARMERLRKDVGWRVMIYLRRVFPKEALDVWSRLEVLAARSGTPDLQKWVQMLEARPGSPERDWRSTVSGRLSEADQD
ncbi:MAG: PrsW family intramembrane metalloprotease [Anaerolineales bacterium]|nr:MAG: PrsW family intramembrane metalloprotease [Anaerolineales bacterium]